MKENGKLHEILNHNGFDASDIVPIKTGKFNSSYVCTIIKDAFGRLKENNKVVLRIAPSDDAGFIFYEKNMMAQEPAIHRIVSEKTSIPIAQIYTYDDSRAIIDHNFLIMEFLTGTPLSEVMVDSHQRDRVMRQTGHYLRELHDNCRTDKYGYLGEHNCMEPQEMWHDAFKIMWNKLIDDIVRCAVYDNDEAKVAREAFDTHHHLFHRDVPSSLLHMDIWGQNILIDDSGTITGIIDWDRALWGDPEIEFSVLDYCGFNNPAFWAGYGCEPEKSPEFKIRMKLYHLYEVQKYLIIWTLRRGSPSRVMDYKQYSQNALQELASMKSFN
ncbi:phosphotransferase [candidate division KSB1 bacterium]|nr:phosphotransferase [candidate division KSB1 bacterium]